MDIPKNCSLNILPAAIPSNTIRDVVGNALYASGGTLLIRALSVIGYAITIQRLTLHDFGVVTLVLSFLAPAGAIVFFGFEQQFTSSVAAARGEQNIARLKGLTREFYIVVGALLIGFCAAAYFGRTIIARYYDVYLFQYFGVALFLAAVQIVLNGIQGFLHGYEKFKSLVRVQVTETAVRNILIILLIARLDIGMVLLIHGIAKLSGIGMGLWRALPSVVDLWRMPERPERRVLVGIIRKYGKWEIARFFFAQLLSPLQVWIVKVFVSTEGVAIFDFARRVYSFAHALFDVKGILFPLISRTIRQKRASERLVLKIKKYMLLYYAIVYVVMLAMLPVATRLLFPKYYPEITVAYLALLHLFIEGYKLGQAAFLYGLRLQKFQFAVLPVGVALQITLDISFVMILGVSGMMLSWHIQALIMGVLTDRYLATRHGVHLWDFGAMIRFDAYDERALRYLKRRFARFPIIRRLLK
ncbi:MAG: hypothetical protein AAB539_02445 [Patescibacteria group bacterium]